jgi:hypothetical protein
VGSSSNDGIDKTKETGYSCNNDGVSKSEETGCTSIDVSIDKSKEAGRSSVSFKCNYDKRKFCVAVDLNVTETESDTNTETHEQKDKIPQMYAMSSDLGHFPVNSKNGMKFQVLMVECMKLRAFWYMAPCSLIEVHQHFRSAYFLRHQVDAGGSMHL